jgi:predicted HNH restriction endonuclease
MKIEVINNIESTIPKYSINFSGDLIRDMNDNDVNITTFNYDYKKSKYIKTIKNFEEEYLETGEFPEGKVYTEGSQKTIIVNAYERDSKKRTDCIRKYGLTCSVCGFNFAKKYGDRGLGFIEVHHTVPLYKMGPSNSISVDDLRPICPNCHSMLHRIRDDMTIEELKEIYYKQ